MYAIRCIFWEGQLKMPPAVGARAGLPLCKTDVGLCRVDVDPCRN